MFSYNFDQIINSIPNEVRCPKIALDKDTRFIGIELEFLHNPHVLTLRDTLQCLQMDKIVNSKLEFVYNKETFTGARALYQAAMQYIVPLYNDLLFKPAHADPNVSKVSSLELSLKPMTYGSFSLLEPQISELLQKCKDLGFMETQECGMHVWVDYSFLGNNIEEYRTTLENFLWFLLHEERYVHHSLCQRVGLSSTLADLKSQLGDSNGLLTPEQHVNLFKKEKKNLLDTLTKGNFSVETNIFNMVFGKDGTQAFEFRWFRSSMEYSDIKDKIKTLLRILTYCRLLGPNNEHKINLYQFKQIESKIKFSADATNLDVISKLQYS